MPIPLRRLHLRGAASRGVTIDTAGATIGPTLTLVHRTTTGFRPLPPEIADTAQAVAFSEPRPPGWLFAQCRHIADSLTVGNPALAQIYGLRIPVADLDDDILKKLAGIAISKAGFDPDEPRVPKGEPGAGEWTDEPGYARPQQLDGQSTSASPRGGASSRVGDRISHDDTDGGDGGTDTGERESVGSRNSDTPTLMPAAGLLAPESAGISLLGKVPPQTLSALALLALRLAAPAAFLGTLFIPRNSSLITEGTFEGRPDLAFRYDRGTGVLTITQDEGAGGYRLLAEAHVSGGRFYDSTGRPVGRTVDGGNVIVEMAALPSLAPADNAPSPSAPGAGTDDEPRLCPDRSKEDITGRSKEALEYQTQITGLEPGLEVVFNNQRYDGCRESDGTLLEAKGPNYAWMMMTPDEWYEWATAPKDLTKQMENHSEKAGQRIVEYHVAEEVVANWLRNYAAMNNYANVIVFYTPPVRKK